VHFFFEHVKAGAPPFHVYCAFEYKFCNFYPRSRMKILKTAVTNMNKNKHQSQLKRRRVYIMFFGSTRTLLQPHTSTNVVLYTKVRNKLRSHYYVVRCTIGTSIQSTIGYQQYISSRRPTHHRFTSSSRSSTSQLYAVANCACHAGSCA
jgi:hypothetical protein